MTYQLIVSEKNDAACQLPGDAFHLNYMRLKDG